MNILFVQLPLLDHSYGYIYGNVEYAPALLAGFIRKKFGRKINTILLPRIISLFGSDTLILKYIKNIHPDMVCFTNYLWNIERNLLLAKKIKEDASHRIVLFGGPEIVAGSIAFQRENPWVDYFVSGEGEWFFNLYLSGESLKQYYKKIKGNLVVSQPEKSLVPVSDIVEPFTSGMLDTMPDGSMYLELTRGCPYRCSYCYYSRHCSAVRELHFDLLLRSLTVSANVKELYILSPTFDRSPHFHERLEQLVNADSHVRLHTEMRADRIDASTAALLYKAGFRSIEIGLQTLNSRALKKVRRFSDPERELKGMVEMKKAGIDLKIGIIPGLPGDTAAEFIKTADRLIDIGFSDNIELYPLMILPGTAVREQTEQNDIQFMRRPPYYYLSGWGFVPDEIEEIIRYIEEKTGYSNMIPGLPDFIQSVHGMFTKGVSFNGDETARWDFNIYRNLVETNIFNFFITFSVSSAVSQGLPLLLKGATENELYNIVFRTNAVIDEHEIEDLCAGLEKDNFYRRLHIFDSWRDGSRFRFFQVVDDFEVFSEVYHKYALVEPILKLTGPCVSKLEKSGIRDCCILVPGGSFKQYRDFLTADFGQSPGLLAFENEDECAEFYSITGNDYIVLPFSFRTVRA